MSSYNINTQDLLDLCSSPDTYNEHIDTQDLFALADSNSNESMAPRKTPAKKKASAPLEHPSPQEDAVAATLASLQTQPSPKDNGSIAKQESSPLALLVSEQVTAKLEEAQKEVVKLKGKVTTHQKKLSAVTKEFDELKQINKSLNEKLSQFEGLDKAHKQRIRTKQQELQDVKQQLSECQTSRKSSYTELKNAHALANDHLNQWKQKAKQLESKKASIEEELLGKQSNEEKLQEYNTLFDEHDNLLEENKNLNRQVQNLQSEITNLRHEVSRLENARSAAQAEKMLHQVEKLQITKEIAINERKAEEQRTINIDKEAQAKVFKESALIGKRAAKALLLRKDARESKEAEDRKKLNVRMQNTQMSIKNAQLKSTGYHHLDSTSKRCILLGYTKLGAIATDQKATSLLPLKKCSSTHTAQ